MFTGIIECLGQIVNIEKEASNVHFTVESTLAAELKIDQSLAHDGVCLTIVKIEDSTHVVTAVAETLSKTNLGQWQIGKKVNLERCMPANGRFDGHIVQGHVDQIATVADIVDQNGSWLFTFTYQPDSQNLTVPKGSITVNGTSLTVVDSAHGSFSVAIIPYTFQHTTFHQLSKGDWVNLEFDIIGKYVQRLLESK